MRTRRSLGSAGHISIETLRMSRRSIARNMPPSAVGRLCERQDCKHEGGSNMLHVPYRGTPAALTGLFAGDAQVMFDTISTSIEHVTAGGLMAYGAIRPSDDVRRTTALPPKAEVHRLSC